MCFNFLLNTTTSVATYLISATYRLKKCQLCFICGNAREKLRELNDANVTSLFSELLFD
jgi:hypothetical protein